MRIHPVILVAAAGWLWLASLGAQAIDMTPGKQPLAIAVNIPGRPAGAVECRVSAGPSVPVTALAFSPDGKTLAAGGYQEVVLWDLAGAKLAKRMAVDGQVGAALFLKDGRTLVVGQGTPCTRGAVRFLDISSGQGTLRSDAPKDVVGALALSPDGKFLAAGGAYNTVHVWNVAEKKPAAALQGHGDWILHVSFSPDGKHLTTAGADNTARVWNVKDWSSVATFTEAHPVRGAAFHPDGLQVLLASGGTSGSGLRFRKIDSPTYRRPVGAGLAIPLAMAGPSKANRVYVACSDATVKVFDVRSGGQVATFSGHRDWVHSVALSADETKLASGSADGTVKLWNSQDGRQLATLVQLAPRADEWLIVTAQGYFAASSPGSLTWATGKTPVVPASLLAQLQNRETVVKVIADEKPKPKPKEPPKPNTQPKPKAKAEGPPKSDAKPKPKPQETPKPQPPAAKA